MTTLAEKIAALPEYPTGDERKWIPDAQLMAYDLAASNARLALAREWIEDGKAHQCDCVVEWWNRNSACTCGRDALLAALFQNN